MLPFGDATIDKKKKRTHGAVTVEASIALTAFLFMFMMLFSLITICRAQAILGVALNNTAKEMSQYTYLYSLTGIHESLSDATETSVLDDINNVADNVNTSFNAMQKLNDDVSTQAQTGITSVEDLMGKWDGMASQLGGDVDAVTQSFTPLQESIETLAEDPIGLLMGLGKVAASDTMNLVKSKVLTPPICRALITKHLKAYDGDDTERFLKKLCIVPYDGATGESYLKGLDFSNSSIYASSDYDIVLHMKYQVRLLPLLPVDLKINLCQTAVTRGWADGDGYHLSADDMVIKREATDINPPATQPDPPATSPATTVTPPVSGGALTVEEQKKQDLEAFFAIAGMDKYDKEEISKIYDKYGKEGLKLIEDNKDLGYNYIIQLSSSQSAQTALASLSLTDGFKLVSGLLDSTGTSNDYEKKITTDLNDVMNTLGTYGPEFVTMLSKSGSDSDDMYYIVAVYGQDGLDFLKRHPEDGVETIRNAKDEQFCIDELKNGFADVRDTIKNNPTQAYASIQKLSPEKQKAVFDNLSSAEIYDLIDNGPSSSSWAVKGYDLVSKNNAKDFIRIKQTGSDIQFEMAFPPYGGYDPNTIESLKDKSGKIVVSRDGGDGGYTMGFGKKEDGSFNNNSERSIPKSSAEVNVGTFDVDLYKASVDIVTGSDNDYYRKKKLKEIGISEDAADKLIKNYNDFWSRSEISGENNIIDGTYSAGKQIDPKYGYYGQAAAWDCGDVKMKGGANQMNTIYSWGALVDAGIIKPEGKVTIH